MIEYIRIDRAIVEMQLSDKAKMLLGLVKGFSSSGLIMSNSELANLLCCSPDNVSRLLREVSAHIRIEHSQSRYRKIFYSGPNARVDEGLLRHKRQSRRNSTPTFEHATLANKHATPAQMPDITNKNVKKLKRTKYNTSDSIEYRLAEILLTLIVERKPDFKEGQPEHRQKILTRWSHDIGLMIRRDQRRPERIEQVIRWAQADSGDGKWQGWQNNILSGRKLREKFDQLEMFMEKTNAGRTNTRKHNRQFTDNPDAITI